MKLSKGYQRALAVISLSYGLFVTVEELEKGEKPISKEGTISSKRDDVVIEETIRAYRDGLKNRLYEFMSLHKGMAKDMKGIVEKMMHKIEIILAGEKVDLDILALYLLYGLSQRPKTSQKIKDILDEEELTYLRDLVVDGYEKKLILRFDHRKLANRILEEVL